MALPTYELMDSTHCHEGLEFRVQTDALMIVAESAVYRLFCMQRLQLPTFQEKLVNVLFRLDLPQKVSTG